MFPSDGERVALVATSRRAQDGDVRGEIAERSLVHREVGVRAHAGRSPLEEQVASDPLRDAQHPAGEQPPLPAPPRRTARRGLRRHVHLIDADRVELGSPRRAVEIANADVDQPRHVLGERVGLENVVVGRLRDGDHRGPRRAVPRVLEDEVVPFAVRGVIGVEVEGLVESGGHAQAPRVLEPAGRRDRRLLENLRDVVLRRRARVRARTGCSRTRSTRRSWRERRRRRSTTSIDAYSVAVKPELSVTVSDAKCPADRRVGVVHAGAGPRAAVAEVPGPRDDRSVGIVRAAAVEMHGERRRTVEDRRDDPHDRRGARRRRRRRVRVRGVGRHVERTDAVAERRGRRQPGVAVVVDVGVGLRDLRPARRDARRRTPSCPGSARP